MFDIGWAELMIIGVVALIVIGPKDLPEMFRTLGRFTAKLRSMSRDFQRAMETAAKEAGVNDVARDLKSATSSKSLGLDAVKDAATRFEKWDPLKPKSPTMPKTPAPVAAALSPAPETIVAPPAAAAVAAPSTPLGPETQAQADKAAARRAITQEAATKLRAVSAPPAAVPPAAAPSAAPEPERKPGRVRTKPAAALAAVTPQVPPTAAPEPVKVRKTKPKTKDKGPA